MIDINEFITSVRENPDINVIVWEKNGKKLIYENFLTEPDERHIFFCDRDLNERYRCNGNLRTFASWSFEATYMWIKTEKRQEMRDNFQLLVCGMKEMGYNIQETGRHMSINPETDRLFITSFFTIYF